MIKKESRNVMRKARHTRIRTKIEGTTEIPRLSVFRSNQNISVQIIDDSKGVTLVSASTLEKDLKVTGSNSEACKIIGEEIAKRALKANIKKVVFDRSGYLYHGRIKVLAEAARAAGLEF